MLNPNDTFGLFRSLGVYLTGGDGASDYHIDVLARVAKANTFTPADTLEGADDETKTTEHLHCKRLIARCNASYPAVMSHIYIRLAS